MWSAARFSLGYSEWQEPCKVDVEEVDEQAHYDFHLLTVGRRYAFQTVEVMDQGRRRGDEYKKMTEEDILKHLNDQPMRNADYAAQRTAEELRKKLNTYGGKLPDLHILCYLNIKAASVPWATVHNGTKVQAKQFASVWVVTDKMLGCIWGGAHWRGLVKWRLMG